MPYFRFLPPPVIAQRSVGEETAVSKPKPNVRALNAVDRNDYELVRDGIHVLNDTLLPRTYGQASREEGSFERQVIGVYTSQGYQSATVTTYDAGARLREVVVAPDVTDASLAAAGAAETAQSSQELSQAFKTRRTGEEAAPDVLEPTQESFYYTGPNTAAGAAADAVYQTDQTQGSVGTTTTTTPPAYSDPTGTLLGLGQPDITSGTNAGQIYDPALYASGMFGGF